jgi:hypothetical protein
VKLVISITSPSGTAVLLSCLLCRHPDILERCSDAHHPTFLPDISPSDFSLFGKVKNALIGREIPDEMDLLESIAGISNDLSNAELQRAFRSWIGRVEKVIAAEGNELRSDTFSSSLFHSKSTYLWGVEFLSVTQR